MIRVVGTIQAPIGEPVPYTSLLIQCIAGSTEVLLNAYSHVQLDETGNYDFPLLNATYRIYANYANGKKIDILGDCTVADGMPEEVTINILVNNFTPVPPDWITDLDNKWQDQWNDFVNDANTQITSINQAITDGDAQVMSDMSTYVNTVTGELGASMTEAIAAGDAAVRNQSIAYTNEKGAELANNILQVSNSVSTVSQELEAYKTESGDEFASINNRIDINEANIGSEISAEVDAQTGAMELRIKNVIETDNASISESLELIQDDLDNQKAAWQVVATVDDLTSSIGMTNDGTNSIIYMQAESLILTNDNNNVTTASAPFYIENDQVYMQNAYIKNLTGDNISASARILVGSGSNQAGINGLDDSIYNGWRFWSGSDTPSNAPYRVDRSGSAWMTNATISGSSTFSGSLAVKSATSGERMEISSNRISVYDSSGILRVRIGQL